MKPKMKKVRPEKAPNLRKKKEARRRKRRFRAVRSKTACTTGLYRLQYDGQRRPIVPTVEELNKEMRAVGYRFEMRSDEEHGVGEEFAWNGITLRVTSKKPDEGHQVLRNWPWRFMYGFEVTATEETQGVQRKTI
jgi:hypothetical protein